MISNTPPQAGTYIYIYRPQRGKTHDNWLSVCEKICQLIFSRIVRKLNVLSNNFLTNVESLGFKEGFVWCVFSKLSIADTYEPPWRGVLKLIQRLIYNLFLTAQGFFRNFSISFFKIVVCDPWLDWYNIRSWHHASEGHDRELLQFSSFCPYLLQVWSFWIVHNPSLNLVPRTL